MKFFHWRSFSFGAFIAWYPHAALVALCFLLHTLESPGRVDIFLYSFDGYDFLLSGRVHLYRIVPEISE